MPCTLLCSSVAAALLLVRDPLLCVSSDHLTCALKCRLLLQSPESSSDARARMHAAKRHGQ